MSTRKFITSFFILIALSANGYCASFASSYIKTEAAAVTRNADVLTMPSSGNTGLTGTTISLSVRRNGSPGEIASDIFDSRRLTPSIDGVEFYWSTATLLMDVWSNTSKTAHIIKASTSINTKYNMAIAYSLNDVRGYFDGVAGTGTPDTSAASPLGQDTAISLGVHTDQVSTLLFGHIKNLRVWSRAFTDAELVTITTP